MITGFDQVDLALLDAAAESYQRTNFDSDLARALVIDNATDITIAFQGTELERLTDLYTDIDANTVDVPGMGSVDVGFWRSLCSVAWRLIPLALAAKARGAKLYLTGHSKGGAEACAFAAMLALLDCRPDHLSLWEPARSLGLRALTLINDIPGIATRNGRDRITALPPWLGQRPLTLLGEPGFTPSLADHGIDAVRAAVLKVVAAPAVSGP